MSTIYLLRHGDIAMPSGQHRFVGQLDLALSTQGREQMRMLAGHPALQGLKRMLTSPLLRCRESAAILSARLGCGAAEVVPEFAEIDLGAWEGLTPAEVNNRFPGEHAARGNDLAAFRPVGGESFADVQHRAWPPFERVAHGDVEPIAIVAHAGINRVLLCTILGMPLTNLFRIKQDYGCCNTILCNGTEYFVQDLNIVPCEIIAARCYANELSADFPKR